MEFKGAWTALVTPFKEDGEIDWDGFKKNVEFQIANGISGLLPVGTTGESPTLTHEEHSLVNKKIFEFAQGRCGVLAGCGSNSTAEAIKSVSEAKEAGINASLIIDCYYNGPSSLELRKKHYEIIAEKFSDVFLIPYIIPGRTGCALSPYDLAVLARKYPNVNAVKEATGDISRMEVEAKILPENFSILSGDDGITFEIMASPKIKAKGVISVITNIAPKAVSQMCELLLNGKTWEAEQIHKKLKPLFDVITVKTKRNVQIERDTYQAEDKFRNPTPIKTIMNALGIPAGITRNPLGKMTPAGVLVVRDALKTVWKLSPEILKPIEEFYGVSIEERLNDDNIWESLAERNLE